MAFIRKAGAGSASLGYTWVAPGAVVEVREEDVRALLSIPHNDFTVVDGAEAKGAPGAESTVEEPAPEAPISEAPAPRRGGRGKAAKATESDAATVEE